VAFVFVVVPGVIVASATRATRNQEESSVRRLSNNWMKLTIALAPASGDTEAGTPHARPSASTGRSQLIRGVRLTRGSKASLLSRLLGYATKEEATGGPARRCRAMDRPAGPECRGFITFVVRLISHRYIRLL
jgi:hypothetical protein